MDQSIKGGAGGNKAWIKKWTKEWVMNGSEFTTTKPSAPHYAYVEWILNVSQKEFDSFHYAYPERGAPPHDVVERK